MITRPSDIPTRADPEPAAPPPRARPPVGQKIQLAAKVSRLRDPYLNIWFEVGRPTPVHEITPWMRAQVSARLLEVL